MVNDGKRLFVGIILLRSLGSESSTLSFTAFDYGYYLQQNDGTYKFTGAAAEAQKLYGVMERHIIQRENESAGADASARKLLEDGKVEKTVTVNVLGDLSLLTGETVVVKEARTGLAGVFWIDADIHTWKNNDYYTKLTLNCRNVMAAASAGSEV